MGGLRCLPWPNRISKNPSRRFGGRNCAAGSSAMERCIAG